MVVLPVIQSRAWKLRLWALTSQSLCCFGSFKTFPALYKGSLRTNEEQPHRPHPPRDLQPMRKDLGPATGEKIEVTVSQRMHTTPHPCLCPTSPNTLKEYWEERSDGGSGL